MISNAGHIETHTYLRRSKHPQTSSHQEGREERKSESSTKSRFKSEGKNNVARQLDLGSLQRQSSHECARCVRFAD
jgi:hypothetical protein